jgi:hypothetical protein
MAETRRGATAQVERRGHFRGRGGLRRRVDVRYRLAGDGVERAPWQTAETSDIGIGGAFVVCEPPPVGSVLEIEVWIPTSDQAITVHAEVRWAWLGDEAAAGEAPADDAGNAGDEADGDAAPARRRGMGVRFSRLDVDALLALSEYFATLTRAVVEQVGDDEAGGGASDDDAEPAP